ncbi:V-type proton ATPase subunit E-like [Actinia tenebrosa]|uniref:V-type proton ATPase subunit E-like n=1 Tax=Actinia tenebrosa TaxID=6105 RepID=A0A6P8IBP6_ACTTE|nr:V-type proton ATPase subunit E-like [Actinia tenebrosa]
MSINDAEVKKQIAHMMAFIEQEAKEKSEEIDAKAEEEFNIEKGRLVQNERLKIMNVYERKEKQVELRKKIQRSNLLNQSRLKILKAQDDHVKCVLEECREQLGSVTKDSAKYKEVLQGLMTQGLFQLLEPKVIICCRQQDLDLVKSVKDAAIEVYKKATKKDIEIIFDEQNFLGQDCSGGIEMLSKGGKIKVVNTLESRLEMMSRQMMPEIRVMLFGRNKGRHFMD